MWLVARPQYLDATSKESSQHISKIPILLIGQIKKFLRNQRQVSQEEKGRPDSPLEP